MKYRQLTEQEINALKSQGCNSHSWDRVRVVTEGFSTDYLHRVTLGGDVLLGANGARVTRTGDQVVRHAGIYQAALFDCTVGDQVYISNIGRFISSYNIEEDVVIENVGEIYCSEESAFGNGVDVSALNEGGGREVMIYDGLTAQIAYVMALYRHRTRTMERLRELIGDIVAEKRSSRGFIGKGSLLVNTLSVVDVRIGEAATIEGATLLKNGTVNSSSESPSYVGVSVTATDFIVARSSRVDSGAMLRKCFVGEGALIENNFSAENSLFFANSHCAHGEACAIFAGPYTVSHHRSTLLIAGYFSFFNAGSGANQSNHMYKTGPVHQGIHRRGCKFGSDAYILLPASTGIFTVVTGRHYQHHDTDQLPFSYLVEEADESQLLPGLALRSYGLVRDTMKWQKRDRRQGVSSDLINYDLMTPYSAGKFLGAIEVCNRLIMRYPTAEEVTWNRVKIKMQALKRGLLLYTQALRSYLGDLFEHHELQSFGDSAMETLARGVWVDVAGMVLPKGWLEELLDQLDRGEINDLEVLTDRFRVLHARYPQTLPIWARGALSQLLGKAFEEITLEDIEEIIALGKEDRKTLLEAIELDSKRDEAPLMSIGYGIDSVSDRMADFHAVRGIHK